MGEYGHTERKQLNSSRNGNMAILPQKYLCLASKHIMTSSRIEGTVACVYSAKSHRIGGVAL